MKEIKESFYLQGKDKRRESFNLADQINFEWNMLYQCNYRCPHCIFDGKWDEYSKRTVYLPADKWVQIWQRIYNKYGRASIIITGGEPFIYPGFIDLITEISKIHYPINISTNSSGNLTEFTQKVSPEKVSITLSYQPGFDKIESVIERIKYLKSKDFDTGYINFCAYPPYLPELAKYIEAVKSQGENLKVIPYYGVYKAISYPDGYTKDEKQLLGLDKAWESNVKTKGSYCAAGYRSALIFPDGKVARCGQIGERHLIGNIFEEDFRLLDRSMQCDAELCPCLKIIEE